MCFSNFDSIDMTSNDCSDPEDSAFILCAPLFPCTPQLLQSHDIWVIDSAATQHCAGSLKHCSNIVSSQGANSITANGSLAHAEVIATMDCMICDNQGTQLSQLKFTVEHHPNAPMNLFSEGQAALQGYNIEGNSSYKRLYNPTTGHEIVFDIPIKTGKGLLWAAHFHRIPPKVNSSVTMVNAGITPKPAEMNIKKAHG